MSACHACGGLYTACRCATPTPAPIGPDIARHAYAWFTEPGCVFFTAIAVGLFATQPITGNPTMTAVHLIGAVISLATAAAIQWAKHRKDTE